MKEDPFALGDYTYQYPDTSGGCMRIHGYTADKEYAFVTKGGVFDTIALNWIEREGITLTRVSEPVTA